MKRTLMAAAAALLMTGPAFGQAACGDYDQIVAAMTGKYGEVETVNAISGAGSAMVIYANPETGTFTVILVAPAQPQLACVVATGTGWTLVPPPAPGDPA